MKQSFYYKTAWMGFFNHTHTVLDFNWVILDFYIFFFTSIQRFHNLRKPPMTSRPQDICAVSTMYVNTPPPIASTIYSIFFFSATSKIPHIIQIDSKFTFMSTVPQANSISLCTISCLMSFGKQSSPPDVKSWTTFFTNKFEKSQKNKPYKVFSRFRTDLSLVGLNCFLYMILS